MKRALAAVLLAVLTVPTPARADDGFRSSIRVVDAATATAMTGVSWRQGCPVPLADLRRVSLTHWGFDRVRRQGELIVHKSVATGVVATFRALYSAGFPIRRMVPVDRFGADDDRSMAADNTSAFNCRPVTGSSTGFSVHSYGRAIDLNPVRNPYVKGRTVLPPAGRAFTDRADRHMGMVWHGDRVWTAFAANGFTWGGDWRTLKDYQHFEHPGR